MKKTILTFGLISGAVASVLMMLNVRFIDRIGMERGYIVGYTAITLSFLLVYFGIRSYRDNVGGGQISFGTAFKIGLGITLISCLCYVITWEVLYFTVPSLHDFTDKYAAYVIEKARASGATDAAILAKQKELADFKVMYENPLINAAMTFLEPFPVGLLMTLISAGLLRRKKVVAEAAV